MSISEIWIEKWENRKTRRHKGTKTWWGCTVTKTMKQFTASVRRFPFYLLPIPMTDPQCIVISSRSNYVRQRNIFSLANILISLWWPFDSSSSSSPSPSYINMDVLYIFTFSFRCPVSDGATRNIYIFCKIQFKHPCTIVLNNVFTVRWIWWRVSVVREWSAECTQHIL